MQDVPAREEGFTKMPPMYLRYISTVGPEQLVGRRPAVQHQNVRIATNTPIVAEPIDHATGTQPVHVRPQLRTVVPFINLATAKHRFGINPIHTDSGTIRENAERHGQQYIRRPREAPRPQRVLVLEGHPRALEGPS